MQMRTLDHWKSRFATTPITIECSEMRLSTGPGHDPPVFTGPGQVEVRSSTAIDFKLFASQPRDGDALERILRAHSNPYDRFEQFRLFATDYEGTEWACGETLPRVENLSQNGALLTGKIRSLYAAVSDEWVSAETGVELLFQTGFDLPIGSSILTVCSIAGEEIQRSWQLARHTLKVFGSNIEFFREPGEDALWVTANASNDMPHLCLENWLSEPFRILFGQLIYPRLVARNLGNGSAHVSLRPSPPILTKVSIETFVSIGGE